MIHFLGERLQIKSVKSKLFPAQDVSQMKMEKAKLELFASKQNTFSHSSTRQLEKH